MSNEEIELEYRANQTLPAAALGWVDGNGALVDFTDSTFTVDLAREDDPLVTLHTKTASIIGGDGTSAPNVTIGWDLGDWAALGTIPPEGLRVVGYVYANRGDGKKRLFQPRRLLKITVYPAPVPA